MKNFKTFESVDYNNGQFNYFQYFREQQQEFLTEFIQKLKNKLVGETVYLRGKKISNPNDYVMRIYGRKIPPIYKIKVKDVVFSPLNGRYDNILLVEVIDENNERYRLIKLVDEHFYNKWKERIDKELDKAQIKRERHISEDPYGEEDWD